MRDLRGVRSLGDENALEPGKASTQGGTAQAIHYRQNGRHTFHGDDVEVDNAGTEAGTVTQDGTLKPSEEQVEIAFLVQ